MMEALESLPHCVHAVIEGSGLTFWLDCRLKDGPVDPSECAACGNREEASSNGKS